MKTILISILAMGLLTPLAGAETLQIQTDKAKYWRYELVAFTVSQGTTPVARATKLPSTLQTTVWKDKKRITAVGGGDSVPAQRNPQGQWTGYWPIPFNPPLGTYTLKVSVWDGQSQTLTARAEFKVRGRKPYALPPGFSVVTYEGGKKGPNSTPARIAGEPKSWRNLIDWADYMGADAFWHCVGQTQIWGRRKEEQYPWNIYSIRLMKRAAQAAHDAGMQYGAWITSFVVIGDKPEETGYRFTLGYNRKQNALRQLRYVSLGCEKRVGHMIELLKKFEADPNVDYLGLDYMRTDFGGYEFAAEFVRDMSISTPADWPKWSESEQSLWMARLIEVERDAAARRKWQWWRAHKVGLVIEHIMAEVKPSKPVWVFSLGWKTGHQHGQDMFMMLDAGIGFNAPMFYSIDKPDFPAMLGSWKRYLNRWPAGVVIGQPVDWNLLGRIKDPPSTQEHLDRQVETLAALKPAAKHFGLFWHDLARAFFGARGPYGRWEWVLAGAASFTRVKAAADRFSFRATLLAPLDLVLHSETELRVEIENLGNSLNAVSVELLPLPRLQISNPAPKVLHAPWPENGKQTAVFRCRTDLIYEPNGGQQMVAIKAVSESDASLPWFDFKYLPVSSELGPPEPQGSTPTAAGTPNSGKKSK